ncbi:MAG: hypothetical protein P9M15_07180 [Candidatus Electryoneaceae bacterium]|nr:hypothetical protein [Candidatus Electryoneaceae bacterium]
MNQEIVFFFHFPYVYYIIMKTKKREKPQFLPPIHFSRRNFMTFAIGLLVLIAGYILMSFGPWDNPLSRSVAPVVLIIGYLIIFPIAILMKEDNRSSDSDRPIDK